MRIAILGTGLMGSAFARVLLRGGVELTVWNRSVDKSAPLVEAGAARAASVADAVSASAAIFVLVLDQRTVRDLLAGHDLTGKTIVNFTTGTSPDAVAARELVTAAGGRYIDAVIPAYPSDIGRREAMIYYAGDEQAYLDLAEPLSLLSGRTPFVGPEVGSTSVLDAAWVGGFHCIAVGGFHEAVSFAMSQGVTIDRWRTPSTTTSACCARFSRSPSRPSARATTPPIRPLWTPTSRASRPAGRP